MLDHDTWLEDLHGIERMRSLYLREKLEPFILTIPPDEEPHTSIVLEKVGKLGDSGYYAVRGGNYGTGFPALHPGVVPEVGDKLHMYSESIGSFFHGIRLNDRVIYWRDKEMRKKHHERYRTNNEVRNRRVFESGARERQDAIYARLPDVFKEQIDESRRKNPAYRWETMGEGYTLLCMDEAVRTAKRLIKNGASADMDPTALYAMAGGLMETWAEDTESGLVSPAHSNNTYGLSLNQAAWLIQHRHIGPEAA